MTEDKLTFEAGMLSRGWLATFLATSADDSLPVLWQTLFIERYDDGIRLVSTDRYLLLSAWIPSTPNAPEPAFDEAPTSTFLVRDAERRAKGLLTHLRKLAARAAKDELPPPCVDVRFGLTADEGAEPGFPGMEMEQVAIEFPDNEAVRLPVVDGEFPAWRSLLTNHEGEATETLAFGDMTLPRLASLGKIVGSAVALTLAGAHGMAKISTQPLGDVAFAVSGGVMPVRLADDEATS